MIAGLDSDDAIANSEDPLNGLPYRALRRIGGGGMGEVYLAQHRQLGRLCVAKVLHGRFAGDTQLADRVRLEAQALGRLNHPHIVSIIGAGRTTDERPFIVMEHLRGHTLADEIGVRGQLPLQDALAYSCQLLRALGAAHALGIIHRDVKPENLFLCDASHGASPARTLKVLDFGLARIMPNAAPEAPQPLAVPTDTGVLVGTPRYSSPEGAAAQRVDHRADLYSAALVLYVMVAGRGPFDHIRSEPMVLSAHAVEEPQPPSQFSKEPVPPELDRVLLRALRKNPSERYQSADELRAQLEEIVSLLESAPGWLDTSVFNVSSSSGRRPSARAEPAAMASSQSSRVLAARSGQLAHGSFIAEPSEGDLDESIGHLPAQPSTKGKVLAAFLSAALVGAVVAFGIVAALRGGQ